MGASPIESAILSERSSVFRALVAVRQHLGTGRSQVGILPFRPFQIAAVVEHMRHPPSKRNDAGGNPAGSAMPGGVKVARRPVKPFGVGASPTLAAIWK